MEFNVVAVFEYEVNLSNFADMDQRPTRALVYTINVDACHSHRNQGEYQ